MTRGPDKPSLGIVPRVAAILLLWMPASSAEEAFSANRANTPLWKAELSALKPGAEFKECEVCPRMVVVPSGSFLMGTPDQEKPASGAASQSKPAEPAWQAQTVPAPQPEDERPAHEVRIARPFAVGRSLVTRAEFGAFVKASGYPNRVWEHPGFEQDGTHPAVNVSWDDAQAYLRWLNGKIPGGPYRLLSEAEAEYIGRAVTVPTRQPDYFFGNSIADLCIYGNGADASIRSYVPTLKDVVPCDDGHVFTAPVASFAPNPFGVYDTIGNAETWVEDCFMAGYWGAPNDGSARPWEGPCAYRATRGGSWRSLPPLLRSASRNFSEPWARTYTVGFRVARSLPR